MNHEERRQHMVEQIHAEWHRATMPDMKDFMRREAYWTPPHLRSAQRLHDLCWSPERHDDDFYKD